MSKKISFSITAFLVLVVGIFIVHAAPVELFTTTNFNLQSGHAFHRTAIQAEYNSARAELTINSMTAGTRKNVFSMARYENGKYVTKATLSQNLTPYTCTRVDMGYIGHGNWMYSDYAGNPNTGEAYAGWAGITKLMNY